MLENMVVDLVRENKRLYDYAIDAESRASPRINVRIIP